MIQVEFCWCLNYPIEIVLDGEKISVEKRKIVLPGDSAALSRFKGTDTKLISNINKCTVL